MTHAVLTQVAIGRPSTGDSIRTSLDSSTRLDNHERQTVGAIKDLGDWLRSLGLEKYEAAFRENEIDETVVPSLTHETLKELGVIAVGHRLKLLDAIAALRADGDANASASDAVAPSTASSASAEDRAGRRQP